MNLNDLQKDWNSPRNSLTPARQRALADKFTRQMVRRRRLRAFWLTHSVVWLTLITGWVGVQLATGRTQLSQEWGFLPLLLVPWGFIVYLLRHYRQAQPTSVDEGVPLNEAVQAALRSNRNAQAQSKVIGALYVIMLPLLGVAMQHLHAAGKVTPRELGSMTLAFGVVLTFCAGFLALRYFTRLRPQERQLVDLASQFKPETAS